MIKLSKEDVEKAMLEAMHNEQPKLKKKSWFKKTKNPEPLPVPDSLRKYVDDQLDMFHNLLKEYDIKLKDTIELLMKKNSAEDLKRELETELSFAEMMDNSNHDKVDAIAEIPAQKIPIPTDGGLELYHKAMDKIGANPGRIIFIRKRGDE